MTRCSEYRHMLLDYRYGLLDAEEAGAVRAHLSDCKACSTAWAESGRQEMLIARAAKGVGPVVMFTAPAAPVTPSTPTLTATTVRASYLGWAAVAAGLLLAVAVLGIPAARDVAAYSRAKPAVERELANLTKVRAEATAARTAAEAEYKSARKSHDELMASWADADRTARSRPDVAVSGPVVPVSGAPNEYQVSVAGWNDGFEAAVKDDAGRVIHTQAFPAGSASLRLPPEAWAAVMPGSDLTLHVSANGTTADPVRLAGPAHATHLTTDKAVYRPGEAVYFRSLTLDQARFTPPTKDIALWYELRSPKGLVVPGCELAGLTHPVAERNGKLAPVAGPDGNPVRGVGTGAFALPADLAGGEYTLVVYEATTDGSRPAGAKPLAATRIVVRKPRASPAVPTPGPVSLEFFPEGGHLIAGVPNRVYVRATYPDGRPALPEFSIADETRLVGQYRIEQGFGTTVVFQPEAGRKYTAKLAGDGTTSIPLPEPKPDGVVFTVADGVTDAGEPIKLTLTSAGAKRSLWVGAYVRGRPVGHARTVAETGRPVEVVLQPVADAPGGVARITVFEEVADGPDKPVAERLVFRRPARQLKLGVAAEHINDNVRLDMTAATEAGGPTPAVLWAAVVRQTAAGGPSLPGHFYLAGEVREPDDLEQADFLLGDHPAAEASLDLVLGTQGWRRFAEQTPDQPRTASFGTRDASFAEFWPKYEAAHARLTEARQRITTTTSDDAPARSAFEAAVGELDAVISPGRWWLRTAGAAGLFLVGCVGLFAIAFGHGRGPVVVGTFGCVALAGAVGLSLAKTGGTHDWRKTVESEPTPTVVLPTAELPPLPEPKDLAAKPDPSKQKFEPMNSVNTSPRFRSMTLPELSGPTPATRVRNEPVAGGTAFRWTPEFAELAKSPSSAEFCKRVMELADANVPRVPPLVVREYAHSRSGNGPVNHVETLLWQPVLVVPGSGTASLSFAVSDAETPYQVLVAGHTLDGRIGAVTTKIEVRKTGR